MTVVQMMEKIKTKLSDKNFAGTEGKLAVQVGEQLTVFFPPTWGSGLPSRLAFATLKQRWIGTFYPAAASTLD